MVVEVDGLVAVLRQLAADGYGLVGGLGEHEGTRRMAYVHSSEGISLSLAQRTG
ncbi:VOC family protein [Kineococcus sp. SYSU DK005]|uniref:hypothetical protein n=1 Tax=Kineococcus sp. SYSU DK005 TaxID=3383126 RepID=UPI003D7C7E92